MFAVINDTLHYISLVVGGSAYIIFFKKPHKRKSGLVRDLGLDMTTNSTYEEIGDAKIVEWFCSYELAHHLVETTYIVLFADRYLLKDLAIHVSKNESICLSWHYHRKNTAESNYYLEFYIIQSDSSDVDDSLSGINVDPIMDQ